MRKRDIAPFMLGAPLSRMQRFPKWPLGNSVIDLGQNTGHPVLTNGIVIQSFCHCLACHCNSAFHETFGMANSKASSLLQHLSLYVRRKYPDDPSKQVVEAAAFGNPDLLSELLQQMNPRERASVLETVYPWDKQGFLHFFEGVDGPKDTPLTVAVRMGNIDCVRVLLSYKADVEGRGGPYCIVVNNDNSRELIFHATPLFLAVDHGYVGVMSCLVEHEANVDAVTKENYTPLMIAVQRKNINPVTFLIEHGANLDLQDKDGNTALHHATRCGSYTMIHKLLDFGAAQLYNKDGLTPLLLASDKCVAFMVEELINRPECTKEQSIDALELLGASIACKEFPDASGCMRAFEYMMRGMTERFQDHLNPLFKHTMEPVEAYQYRKESESVEELAQIEGDDEAIYIEGLIIRERILGTESKLLLKPIEEFASYYEDTRNFHACIALHRHAIKIDQNCNKSISDNLESLIEVFWNMTENDFPLAEKVVLEVLEETILEFEKLSTSKLKFTQKYDRLREAGDFDEVFEWTQEETEEPEDFLSYFLTLLDLFSKAELCEEEKTSDLSVLRKLVHMNPLDCEGNTLLHMACGCGCKHSCDIPLLPKTLKLLLDTGFNVNATNSAGNTPLHVAVSFDPSIDPSKDPSILTETLEVLLDGGAHYDFLNNKGETAIDVAKTDGVRRILSERKKLELKCISARAVKKFGLPYLGVVPKTLEKYISMH